MSSSETVAVRVEAVSKSFRPPRDPIARLGELFGLRNMADDSQPAPAGEFHALRGVSFEVERGQVFGILGQNGSGKSTLLQIIAGIMSPSSGSVSVQGKVAALLELGSGFNPEFTGIENVYLNASVLGLSRSEINDKLQAIIDFAEIGGHVDLPVKTYSSGMMLRLAFAVQVAIEPEILIIDEALAVGDAKFQLKCFRRLAELKANGTTILFVSHATELVKSFCDIALVLDKGRPIFLGDVRVATIKYLETMFPDQQGITSVKASVSGSAGTASTRPNGYENGTLTIDTQDIQTNTFGIGGAGLSRLQICGIEPPNVLVGGQDVSIIADFDWDLDVVRELVEAQGYKPNITLGVAFANTKGAYLFGCNGFDSGLEIDCFGSYSARLRFNLKMPRLLEGDYFITAAIALGDQVRHVQLKWYDCFVTLRCITQGQTVNGIFAIDYTIELLDRT